MQDSRRTDCDPCRFLFVIISQQLPPSQTLIQLIPLGIHYFYNYICKGGGTYLSLCSCGLKTIPITENCSGQHKVIT